MSITPEQQQAGETFQKQAEQETWEKTDLDRMSDNVLAQWQAKYEFGSREVILADQQWRIRLLKRQLKASRRLAWLSCFFGLAGVLLGFYLHVLDRFLDRRPQDVRIVSPQPPSKQHTDQGHP